MPSWAALRIFAPRTPVTFAVYTSDLADVPKTDYTVPIRLQFTKVWGQHMLVILTMSMLKRHGLGHRSVK